LRRKQEVSRAKLFSAVAAAQESAAAAQKERDTGQTSLLALFGGGTAAAPPPNQDVFSQGEEWTPKQVLAFEKESLGFYISGHPLDRFAGELKRFANATTANCTERGPRAEVILGGVVGDYQERVIKSGTGKYAFFKLEDQVGTIEFHVASAKLDGYREVLTSGEPLLITGTVDAPFGEGETARERLRFMDAKPLASIRAERSSLMEIRLNADLVTDEQMTTLHTLLRQFPGPCHTRLRLEIPQRSETVLDLGDDFKVAAADELLGQAGTDIRRTGGGAEVGERADHRHPCAETGLAGPRCLSILVSIFMATSVHLPMALLEAVDRKARALRISRNQLVLRALEHDLQGGADWSPGFFARLSDVDQETASDVDDLLRTVRKARKSKPARRL
jgi:hypothetical protein